MKRRTFLHAGLGTLTAGAAISAGYIGASGTPVACEPPLPENRPDTVYYPSHIQGMKSIGVSRPGKKGETTTRPKYKCALLYSSPHRFWTVTGNEREKVSVKKTDSIHLMVAVWYVRTGTPLSDTNPTVHISRDGEAKETVTLWPMLSQNMGFHAGDNIPLSGEGQYSITVDVTPPQKNATAPHKPNFGNKRRFDFEFVYRTRKLSEIASTGPKSKSIQPGAANPTKMNHVPITYAPKWQNLPGKVVHDFTTGDAAFVVSLLENKQGKGESTYLAVSARTPYNRYVLPGMSLTAQGIRDGNVLFNESLSTTVSPNLSYHYGRNIKEIKSEDTIEITIDAPPQIARHEGYETAFFNMQPERFVV
ncbi:iron transporter [Halococcus sediminicola]|uniref:iron transporter n=1 Tax=Halococcus sediminicola TaxID=1264579 RepID=UPI0009AD7FA0|nr:iron transporter [Halococcus sediminicola]